MLFLPFDQLFLCLCPTNYTINELHSFRRGYRFMHYCDLNKHRCKFHLVLQRIVNKCNICTNFKKKNKPKYGRLPKKKVEPIPWSEVNINFIGPYTVKM